MFLMLVNHVPFDAPSILNGVVGYSIADVNWRTACSKFKTFMTKAYNIQDY
jgi:hypothetical protein